jgi:hypothetical protein
VKTTNLTLIREDRKVKVIDIAELTDVKKHRSSAYGVLDRCLCFPG